MILPTRIQLGATRIIKNKSFFFSFLYPQVFSFLKRNQLAGEEITGAPHLRSNAGSRYFCCSSSSLLSSCAGVHLLPPPLLPFLFFFWHLIYYSSLSLLSSRGIIEWTPLIAHIFWRLLLARSSSLLFMTFFPIMQIAMVMRL